MQVTGQFNLFGDSDITVKCTVSNPKKLPDNRLDGAHVWFSQVHEYWLDWSRLKFLERKENPTSEELAEILEWREDFEERGDGSALCEGGVWPSNPAPDEWHERWGCIFPGDEYTEAQKQELDRLVHFYYPGGYDAFLKDEG